MAPNGAVLIIDFSKISLIGVTPSNREHAKPREAISIFKKPVEILLVSSHLTGCRHLQFRMPPPGFACSSARIKSTGMKSQVEVPWGHRKKWNSIGDFGGIVLSLDKALKYVDG